MLWTKLYDTWDMLQVEICFSNILCSLHVYIPKCVHFDHSCDVADSRWDSSWEDWQRDLQKAWRWLWGNSTLCPKVWYADCSLVAIPG